MKNFLRKYKSLSLFTFSSVFLNIATLFAGFIVYKWIDPFYMGLWQTLLLIDTYSTFLRIGVINGMNRQLPFSLGSGDVQSAQKYVETALFYTLLTIIIIILLAISSLFFIKLQTQWLFPLIFIFIIVVLNTYQTFLSSTYRANSDFNSLSKIQIFSAVLKIITIALVIYWGFKGFVIREFLCLLVITLVTHIWRPIRNIVPRYNKKILIDLIKVGAPIFIGSYIIAFINTGPRLLLIKYGTIASVGIYAPLYTIINTITVLPDSITTFLYPKMSYQIGKNNDKLALWKKTVYTHFGLVIIGLPIVIVGIIFLPYLIHSYLPKYSSSVPIINTGIFIALFMSYKFGYTTLITLKAWKFVIAYICLFGLLQFSVPFMLMNFLPLLKAIVFGQLITAFLMMLVSLTTSYYATH